MAASMVMTLPSILVFILLQRYYIQGVRHFFGQQIGGGGPVAQCP